MKTTRKSFINGSESMEADKTLKFYPAWKIEYMQDKMMRRSTESEYSIMAEYAHLRECPIDLEGISLTDKQLMAVSMVFYGGIKKSRRKSHECQQPGTAQYPQLRAEKNCGKPD